MRGKYSPTVNAAYMKDQEWWNKYSGSDKPSVEYIQYDPDGYDSYGYDSQDMDRAGNYEYEYYSDDDHDGGNIKYNIAVDEWGFDGTKPQARYEPVVAEGPRRALKGAAARSGVRARGAPSHRPGPS